jgi:hypothetical protein
VGGAPVASTGGAAMGAGMPPVPVTSWRQHLLRFVLAVMLTVALLTPPVLLIDRPPSSSQLTIIGTEDGTGGALSLLLEGAGGGRVLIGGGASGADLPAALARTAPPWRDRVDLLLVVDARDLAGATELVRRGRVGQVATVGLTDERAAALIALRERCAANGVPLRVIGAGERIAIGREGALTLDVRPGVADEPPTLALVAGGFSAAIVTGDATVQDTPSVAIVPRGTLATYRAAIAAGPRLLVAPVPPTGGDPAMTTQLLLVVPGQRVMLDAAGANLRLRGGTPTTLAPDTAR